MGKIGEFLVEMLRRQVMDHGIIVWYDPQEAYASLIQRLDMTDTAILRYEDGFFRLREQLEPFLEKGNGTRSERGHPLKGPCQEEKRILSKKKYFSWILPNGVSVLLTFAEISSWTVSVFAAPVTHQDQGHGGVPSSIDCLVFKGSGHGKCMKWHRKMEFVPPKSGV